MARRCAVSGKTVRFGNNVSHANNKTGRQFRPNLQGTAMLSDALGQIVRMRVSTNAIRTIEKNGGIDAFLLGRSDRKLEPVLIRLKRRIEKARARVAN